MKLSPLSAVTACVFAFTNMMTVQAVPVLGQGTWETTLEGRLETAPGSGVFLAYYDNVLDITWAADADIIGFKSWSFANAWAAGLTLGGVSGWRLPTLSPINGSTFDFFFSNNATTDRGFAPTTTDGMDGGWRDGSNTPVSEMGHMYYVTLGNLGFCTADDAAPTECTQKPGWGLTNTGPFSDVESLGPYWGPTVIDPDHAWRFSVEQGIQFVDSTINVIGNAWAVRSGDVPAVVPVPAAIWLFGSGLLGMMAIARGKKAG